MNQEIWRNIDGYKGVYQVSNFGQVRSFKTKKALILKPRKNQSGYFYVNLCQKGFYKSISIHRLVALAFVNGNTRLTVNHKDGNKENNSQNNLEWCSQKDNFAHFIANNIQKISGENNGRAKLTIKNVKEILFLAKQSRVSSRSLAFRFGVSKSQINDIINKRKWVNLHQGF